MRLPARQEQNSLTQRNLTVLIQVKSRNSTNEARVNDECESALHGNRFFKSKKFRHSYDRKTNRNKEFATRVLI